MENFSMCSLLIFKYMRVHNKNSLNIFMNKMWGLRQIIDRIGMLRAWWQADKRRKNVCEEKIHRYYEVNSQQEGRRRKSFFLKLAEKICNDKIQRVHDFPFTTSIEKIRVFLVVKIANRGSERKKGMIVTLCDHLW